MNEVAKLTNLKHLKITGMGSVSFSPGVYTLIKESRALKQILTNSLGANIFWKFERINIQLGIPTNSANFNKRLGLLSGFQVCLFLS